MAKVKAFGRFRAWADAKARRRIPCCLGSMKALGHDSLAAIGIALADESPP